jgi:hypothetical protein
MRAWIVLSCLLFIVKMLFAPGTCGTTDQALFIFRKPN